MKQRLTLLTLVTTLILAGCAETGERQAIGGVLGAAGGGLLGSQFGSGTGQLAMTALGAVGGLLIGSSIGRSMDDLDRLKHQHAASSALESLPSGESATWRNPDSGHSGYVMPTRTYQRSDGTYCREFTQMINVGGKTEEGYGTACRQPDGSWKIVS